MDRKIKFRGRYDYDKTWFYGNLFYPDIKGRAHVATPQKGCYDINPSTIGEFTGREDVTQTEIFEDDILSWHDDIWGDSTEFRGLVFYKDAAFWVRTEEYYLGSFVPDSTDEELLLNIMDFEPLVIGNIHDNPELFKMPENHG